MEADGSAGSISSRDTNGFWISYSAGHGPTLADQSWAISLGISLRLDAKACQHFIGLRLIIVCNWEEVWPFTVKECQGFDSEARPLRAHPVTPKELQPAHVHRRNLQNCRKHAGLIRTDSSREESNLSVCTITLELSEAVPNAFDSPYTIRPARSYIQKPTFERKILYDKFVWTHNEADPSTVIWFDVDLGDPNATLADTLVTNNGYEIPVYFVRILSTSQAGEVMVDLPSHVIKRIVRHAIDPAHDRDWRNQILDYALLQKSWLPALEVFWEDFGYVDHGYHMGIPISVAQTLQRQPHRAKLITSFFDNCAAVWHDDLKTDATALVNASCSIVLAARHTLTRLDLGIATLPAVVHVLPDLENLRSFRASCARGRRIYTGTEEQWARFAASSLHLHGEDNCVSLGQIVQAVEHWPLIEEIVIDGWVSGTDLFLTDPDDALQSYRPSQSKTLKRLTIEHVTLSHSNLSKLSSESLSVLVLRSIWKICNADLVEFLTSVSSTLSELMIAHCKLNTEGNELHAIEQALPLMLNIQRIDIIGQDNLSMELISRRARRPMNVARKPPYELYVDTEAYVLPLGDLTGALEVTGWESIMISSANISEYYDGLTEATKVAKRRGIDFAWYG